MPKVLLLSFNISKECLTSSNNVVRCRECIVKRIVLFFIVVFKFHLIDKVLESSIQVKVKYGPAKWVNFFVAISRISSGGYTFLNLVDNIVQQCPAISHLNLANIRIRYQDDEGSYINLTFLRLKYGRILNPIN